jgi:mRNA interferase RelE/StbE
LINIRGNEGLYNIYIKKSAEKDLDKINEPFICSIINEIDNLISNPRNEKVIKLTGKENQYRLRIGNYRVLFFIIEDEKNIKISRVLRRKEAYRK